MRFAVVSSMQRAATVIVQNACTLDCGMRLKNSREARLIGKPQRTTTQKRHEAATLVRAVIPCSSRFEIIASEHAQKAQSRMRILNAYHHLNALIGHAEYIISR